MNWLFQSKPKFENLPNNLDKNVLSFLGKLSKDHTIIFEVWDEDFAEVVNLSHVNTITYNPKTVDSAIIAHELLHIWLLQFKYTSSKRIFILAREIPKLSSVYSKELCDHIGNCMDHIKMFPQFLKMGFKPKDFIDKKGGLMSNLDEIKALKEYFNSPTLAIAVDIYIGNMVSILADHISNDYSEHLKTLKEIDESLFDITLNFWNRWEEYDINSFDKNFETASMMLYYVEEMSEWCNCRLMNV